MKQSSETIEEVLGALQGKRFLSSKYGRKLGIPKRQYVEIGINQDRFCVIQYFRSKEDKFAQGEYVIAGTKIKCEECKLPFSNIKGYPFSLAISGDSLTRSCLHEGLKIYIHCKDREEIKAIKKGVKLLSQLSSTLGPCSYKDLSSAALLESSRIDHDEIQSSTAESASRASFLAKQGRMFKSFGSFSSGNKKAGDGSEVEDETDSAYRRKRESLDLVEEVSEPVVPNQEKAVTSENSMQAARIESSETSSQDAQTSGGGPYELSTKNHEQQALTEEKVKLELASSFGHKALKEETLPSSTEIKSALNSIDHLVKTTESSKQVYKRNGVETRLHDLKESIKIIEAKLRARPEAPNHDLWEQEKQELEKEQRLLKQSREGEDSERNAASDIQILTRILEYWEQAKNLSPEKLISLRPHGINGLINSDETVDPKVAMLESTEKLQELMKTFENYAISVDTVKGGMIKGFVDMFQENLLQRLQLNNLQTELIARTEQRALDFEKDFKEKSKSLEETSKENPTFSWEPTISYLWK